MRHEAATFGQKNTYPEISVIIFFAFSSLSTTKTPKLAETPIFIVI